MGSLGGAELIIIGLVVLVLFGAGGLPKAARSLGKAKVEVDKAKTEYENVIAPVAEAKRKFDQATSMTPQQMAKRALMPAPSEPPVEGSVAELEALSELEPHVSESVDIGFPDQPLPFDDVAGNSGEGSEEE